MTRDMTRRQFLGTTAAAGASLGIVGFTAAKQAEAPTVIRLGGKVPGWQGRAPDPISGKTNPTLNLQEGKQYVVVWENVDGQPHNFAIRGSNDENLSAIQPVINNTTKDNETVKMLTANNSSNMSMSNMSGMGNMTNMSGNESMGNQSMGQGGSMLLKKTPTVSTKGNVQALSFTASSNMKQYICTVHPTTMVGDVKVGDEGL